MHPAHGPPALTAPIEGIGRAPVIQSYLHDTATGMRGFIIVDTLVQGKSMGGVRMGATVTPAEIASLARAMSLKFALGEVPIGGTKGGIVLPSGKEIERDRILDAFGRLVAPLLHGGIYLGTDMGISFDDRKRFMDAAEFEVQSTNYGANLPCDWQSFWRECVDVGGYGVSEAALAILPLLDLVDRPVTVAVHGFGTMGRGAARHLARAGHRVVAIADSLGSLERAGGLPVEAIIEATNPAGIIDRSVVDESMNLIETPASCLEYDADVLVVASREDVIHAGNAERLRCRLIVEAANHPCTPEAMRILAARGVAIAPGIIANAGSAMTSGLVVSGSAPTLPMSALKAWVYEQVSTRIRRNMTVIWELAQRAGQDMPSTASRLAEERVAGAR